MNSHHTDTGRSSSWGFSVPEKLALYGLPRAQDYLRAIRVGRRQTENSRRNWKEIRSDQRADPAVAEYRPGETAKGARQKGEADRTARPDSIPQTRLSRSHQDAASRGQSYYTA